MPNFDFYGSTIVTQSFIRLTPDQQSKQGGIFNRIVSGFRSTVCPLTTRRSSRHASNRLSFLIAISHAPIRRAYPKQPIQFRNWEVVVEFKIDGHRKDLFGDGMAFWYVKNPLRPGNVFGHEDQFDGLGIFFDTYANQNGAHNHAHPYISAMVNNGTLRYDHDTDGSHYQVGDLECFSRFSAVSLGIS